MDDKLNKLYNIITKLRSENGCPWDKEQTHESMIPSLIEETYEVVDSIQNQNFDGLKEELGDLLFNLLFQIRLAEEKSKFSMEQVIDEITEKLIRRHPHVFGNTTVQNSDEVLKQWNEIKAEEKKDKPRSLMDSVPKSYPALLRAEKLQYQAKKVGFDWSNTDDVINKVHEEWNEFLDEVNKFQKGEKNQDQLEDELGDVFFVFTNLSRFLKLNPEKALNRACNKFQSRFQYIEEQAILQNLELKKMTLEEMDKLWNQAKQKEKESKSI